MFSVHNTNKLRTNIEILVWVCCVVSVSNRQRLELRSSAGMMALGHASQHVGYIKKTEKKGKEILFNIQGIRSKYAFTSSWLGESDKPEGWILNSLDSSASL